MDVGNKSDEEDLDGRRLSMDVGAEVGAAFVPMAQPVVDTTEAMRGLRQGGGCTLSEVSFSACGWVAVMWLQGA